MAKFYGAIGYGHPVETAPGVTEDVIVERNLYGDVLRNTRSLQTGEKVNNDLSVGNSISVVADAYANDHFHAIKYVWYSGVRWLVPEITVEPPRLILRLGGVYNGPGPEASTTPVSSPDIVP